jgi:hypothetical protein
MEENDKTIHIYKCYHCKSQLTMQEAVVGHYMEVAAGAAMQDEMGIIDGLLPINIEDDSEMVDEALMNEIDKIMETYKPIEGEPILCPRCVLERADTRPEA